MILAIDPGNTESAYCFIDEETYKPTEFDKKENWELFDMIRPKTNAEKIRSMSDEELAEFLCRHSPRCYDLCADADQGCEVFCKNEGIDKLLDWLHQPAEEARLKGL